MFSFARCATQPELRRAPGYGNRVLVLVGVFLGVVALGNRLCLALVLLRAHKCGGGRESLCAKVDEAVLLALAFARAVLAVLRLSCAVDQCCCCDLVSVTNGWDRWKFVIWKY